MSLKISTPGQDTREDGHAIVRGARRISLRVLGTHIVCEVKMLSDALQVCKEGSPRNVRVRWPAPMCVYALAVHIVIEGYVDRCLPVRIASVLCDDPIFRWSGSLRQNLGDRTAHARGVALATTITLCARASHFAPARSIRPHRASLVGC